MREVLHIVIKPNDALTAGMIATQQKQPDTQVTIMDLTVAEPDYTRLLEAIFAADSVAVW